MKMFEIIKSENYRSKDRSRELKGRVCAANGILALRKLISTEPHYRTVNYLPKNRKYDGLGYSAIAIAENTLYNAVEVHNEM